MNDLFSSIGGTGTPLVLVHGFGISGLTWKYIIPILKNRFQYHAIDLPGFGNSIPCSRFTFTLEAYAEALRSYIVRKNLTETVLVGQSLGATIALLSLITGDSEYCSRVKQLCLLDAVCYPFSLPFFISIPRVPVVGRWSVHLIPSKLQIWSVLYAAFYDIKNVDPNQVQEYANFLDRGYVQDAILTLTNSLDQGQLSRYVEGIQSIRKQSLIIWGADDRIVPLEYGRRLASDLKNSRLVVIEKCGHMPQEEKPLDTARAILRHIPG